MSDMLTKLGIDWRHFIAQMVNFLILFGLLRVFAWKPLIMALEDRRAKIRKGIDDADRAKEQLTSLEKDREEVLAKARAEGMRVIEQAQQKAVDLQQEKIRQTDEEVEKELAEAKERIQGERLASYNALKQDLAKLITSATGKIVQDMDKTAHEKLIQAAIKDLET